MPDLVSVDLTTNSDQNPGGVMDEVLMEKHEE